MKQPTTAAPRLHSVRATSRPHFGAYCVPVPSVHGAATGSAAPDPRTPRGSAFARHLDQAAAAVKRSHHGARPQHRPPAWSLPDNIYHAPELAPYTGRPGAMDAMALPSRMGDRLHYRGGAVVTMPAAQHPARPLTKA